MSKCSYKRCRQAGDAVAYLTPEGHRFDFCATHWVTLCKDPQQRSIKEFILDVAIPSESHTLTKHTRPRRGK